jgi:hypothetical protein
MPVPVMMTKRGRRSLSPEVNAEVSSPQPPLDEGNANPLLLWQRRRQ